MNWTPCEERLPDGYVPGGDAANVVVAFCKPGTRADNLLQYDLVNAVWFRSHWESAEYTHWQYVNPPKMR